MTDLRDTDFDPYISLLEAMANIEQLQKSLTEVSEVVNGNARVQAQMSQIMLEMIKTIEYLEGVINEK